jgi:hypothetical protein
VQQSLLDLIVGGQHRQIQSDGSDDGWSCSTPQPQQTILFGYPSEGVDHVSVVSALSDGELAVGLHSYEGQIGWVANQGAYQPCKASGVDPLQPSKIF